MKKWIKAFFEDRRLKDHRAHLAKACILGKEFCAGPWQKKTGILNFSVINSTGNPQNVRVGDYCNLNASIFCNTKGQVKIGDYVYMNAKTTIRCDYSINIGNCCLFGPNVRLWDTRNHPMSVMERERQAKLIRYQTIDSYEAGGGPIHIEDNVWLGLDVIVLAGVRIGYGSIVGAGSVVTKDIPPMTFAAGVPAMMIRPIS